jgi:3-deoxy-D-arabino-heptulosonate 7-phosphate (DAHP) synthase
LKWWKIKKTKEVAKMDNRYNYALVDGDSETVIIQSDCSIEQFKSAINFAKGLVDYSSDDITNTLKWAGFFAEHIHVDHEFPW